MFDVNWTRVLVFGLAGLVAIVLALGILLPLFGGGLGLVGSLGLRREGLLVAMRNIIVTCLLPLAIVSLLAMGGVWLVRNAGGASEKPVVDCPSCGQDVQPSWKTCPNCGEDLQGEE